MLSINILYTYISAPEALLGIYLGARLQKFVPQRFIKLMLGTIIVLLALKYIVQFFLR